MSKQTELAQVADTITVNSGKIGIGTSSPSGAKLQVTGSNYNDQLVIERTDTSSKWSLAGIDSGGFQIYDVNSGNATRMTIDSSGNVGIGTSSPTEDLTIASTSPQIRLEDTDASGTPYSKISGVLGNVYIQADDANEIADSKIDFRVDGIQRAIIDSSGRVGIGTSSPARTLEVYSSAPAIKLNNGTNAFTIGTGAFVDGSNSLVFFDEGVGERMRIDSNGVLKINGGSAWNETNQGTGKGSIHLDPNSIANDTGGAITFGASDVDSGETAMAGIYTRSDSTYGTKMYLATTDSYSNGPKTAVKVDHGGRVTTPRQPYFNVTRNSASYTLGNNDTFVFDRVMSNTGGHYNSSTGRFTAPVAGKYLFIFQTIVLGTYNSASVRYWKNGSRFYGSDMHFSPNPSSNGWTNVTNNQIVAMNANDYIEVKNLGPSVNYHGDHWAHLTGMLLG